MLFHPVHLAVIDAATILFALGGVAVGVVVALVATRMMKTQTLAAARAEASRTVENALAEAKITRSKAETDAERLISERKAKAEAESEAIRKELKESERRLEKREEFFDKKIEMFTQKEEQLQKQMDPVKGREQEVAKKDAEVAEVLRQQQAKLLEVARMTVDEARRELLQRVEEDSRLEMAKIVAKQISEAEAEAKKKAQEITLMAIQRYAAEHTAESTVRAVPIPSDDMKGRIIGREGRNIRAFELATGVDVIIDDTPDTVVVSCFDPVRRETARLALEKLVSDGRIHPGRIEEVVAKSRKEVEVSIVETGEEAAYEVGVHGLHPELVKLVGRMRWRTSYGQNILNHSKEVAWLAGIMAAELGLDVALAKRGALLHDVGKVLTHEHEGTHVELGVEVATRYGENPLVVNCIAAHHDDVPHESEVSVLVQAADAISGARPGARREAFETYVKRLEGLERIASSYRGVEKVFAIQAGREIRVIVTPEDVDDGRMASLTEEIARRIESELQYPGQIKVVVIRETRAVDFAR